jgi:geranylgeranyl reductase family protein
MRCGCGDALEALDVIRQNHPAIVTSSSHSVDRSFDVAVVGAGPAGAAVALYLARAGVSVAVVDRAMFPRDKSCGDFLSPVALSELAALGLNERSPLRRGHPIRAAAVFLHGAPLVVGRVPHVANCAPFARVVPRKILDDWLAQRAVAAGAVLFERHQLAVIERERHGMRLGVDTPQGRRWMRARVIVGADGSGSTVARLLRGRIANPDTRLIAIRAYFNDVDGPSARADLYFGRDWFPGYCWLFPTRPGQANVGVGVPRATVPAFDEALPRLLQRCLASDAALAQRLSRAQQVSKPSAWPINTYDPRQPLVGDRWLLVGDAGGLVNPLNGEGIQHALQSGRWAADALREALNRGDCSSKGLEGYAHHVERELGLDLALASFVVQTIRNRHLADAWLAIIEAMAELARDDPRFAFLAAGILTGAVPVRFSTALLGPIMNTAVRKLGRLARGTLPALLRDPQLLYRALARAGRLADGMLSDRSPLAWWTAAVAERRNDIVRQALNIAPRDHLFE